MSPRSAKPDRQRDPQLPEGLLEQQAFLNILKTADVLNDDLWQLLKPADLSPTQYNVLRILRGAGSEGMACGQIAGRMLTHDPDMTRLLDRLEKRQWIERFRGEGDRRVVRARLLPAAAKLLASLDRPVMELHLRQFAHLPGADLARLLRIMERIRERT